MNTIKVAFNMYYQFAIKALGYVSLFFVSRYMGAEALGIIAFSWAYIALFQSFSDLGFGTAHTKRVSEGKDFGICNGVYFSAKTILNVLMVMIVLITIFYCKYILDKPFVSREHEIVLYIILAANFIGNFTMMFIVTFEARKEFAKGAFAFFTGKIVLVGSKVFVAVSGLSVIFLASSNILSSIIILIIYLFFFKGYPVKKPTKAYFKSYFKFALPVMFIGFLSKYSHNLDQVMIQFFWSTGDVGRYAAAKQISMLLFFLTSASSAILFPTISKLHSQGNFEGIKALTEKTERFLSMILLPIIIFMSIYAKQICFILLGNDFIALTPNVLTVLLIVVYFQAIAQPYMSQIGGTNHIKLAAVLSAIILGTNIVLNLIFIPTKLAGIPLLGLGAIGAALATLISAIIGKVIFNIFAYRITGSKQNPVILVHLAAGAIMAVTLCLCNSHISNIVWYYLPVLAIIGFGVYLYAIILMKEFKKTDFEYIMRNISPISIKNYAKKEIKEGYVENRV